jgi:dihydropteroate synthase
MAKDTFFCPKMTLNCRGKIKNLSTPLVMGILNIAPDSFYDGGRYTDIHSMLNKAASMVSEGADIIDVGAASTRPGAALIDPTNEINKLRPALKHLNREFPDTIISVDTYHSSTVAMAIDEGAHMINDISAGSFDPQMFATIAAYNIPYIIMHIQGTPETMQLNPSYDNIINDMVGYFSRKIIELNNLGVHDVIIDPGFGFGKTLEHNYHILSEMDFLRMFERPILVGLSRKSMINRVLSINPEKALNGTTVLNTIALMKGADILRVHDVKEARETIKIMGMINAKPR